MINKRYTTVALIANFKNPPTTLSIDQDSPKLVEHRMSVYSTTDSRLEHNPGSEIEKHRITLSRVGLPGHSPKTPLTIQSTITIIPLPNVRVI